MFRRNSPRSFLGGISGGVFLIGLAIAFFSGHFLPVLFVTLAITTLLGAASSMRPNGLYGGLFSFVWMLGLAFCFAFGFWPWIMVVVGVSAILGALRVPIMAAILGAGIFGASRYNAQPMYQPYQQQPTYQEQPGSNMYQQGYQPPPQPQQSQQPPEVYQEGNRQYPYPPQQSQSSLYEQPEAQYPPQQMPPQQQ